VEFLDGNFAVVERAEDEPAAVGAEVAGEIMCGHGESSPVYLMRRANAVSNVTRENERRGPRSSRIALYVSISTKTFAIARRRRILNAERIYTD
jgi:hypothetical protein